MGFKIEHGSIKGVGDMAYGAGLASYKRLLDQQAFQASQQAQNRSFQAAQMERGAQIQAERDDRAFNRQKELVGINQQNRLAEQENNFLLDVAKTDELTKLNNQRRQEMDQWQYDVNKQRKVDDLNRYRAYIDNLVSEGRYAEDDPEIIRVRGEVEAEEAGIHMSAVPKPRFDPEKEAASRTAMVTLPDGTQAITTFDSKGNPRLQLQPQANRDAVYAKMAESVWKSLSGKTDGEGNPVEPSEEEFQKRMEIMMRGRERFNGKPDQAQTPPPAQTEAMTEVQKKEVQKNQQQFIKQRIEQMPPVQRQQLEEEKDRIMERMKWAKGAGAHIEYARAKEELATLIQNIVQPPAAVQPPMETAGVQ